MKFAVLLFAFLVQDQEKIDKAIDDGAAWLLKQEVRGTNHPSIGTLSEDELVLYTLIHARADRKHKFFQKILKRVLDKDLEHVYTVSVMAMALEALDRDKYQLKLAHCAQFLVDNQCDNGQWSYGKKVRLPTFTKGKRKIRIRRRSKGPAAGDNSNVQYAALGLRACMKAGIGIPKRTLALGLKWWRDSQKQDGGWGYDLKHMPGGMPEGPPGMTPPDPSYGSMTAGAVGACVIFRHYLKSDFRKSRVIRAGFKWLANNFSVRENPSHPMQMWHFYWLYALERAGMLAEREKVGSHDWYAEGAKWLLDNQKDDGSWSGASPGGMPPQMGGKPGGDLSETCFAILFLRRATGRVDVATVGARKKEKKK